MGGVYNINAWCNVKNGSRLLCPGFFELLPKHSISKAASQTGHRSSHTQEAGCIWNWSGKWEHFVQIQSNVTEKFSWKIWRKGPACNNSRPSKSLSSSSSTKTTVAQGVLFCFLDLVFLLPPLCQQHIPKPKPNQCVVRLVRASSVQSDLAHRSQAGASRPG